MLPFFSVDTDPGPDFAGLVRRVGLQPPDPTSHDGSAAITHGTTCVAVRYVDGVVMAGDRRATSGNWISHRSIEKVFPADRHSGVAIAGAANSRAETRVSRHSPRTAAGQSWRKNRLVRSSGVERTP